MGGGGGGVSSCVEAEILGVQAFVCIHAADGCAVLSWEENLGEICHQLRGYESRQELCIQKVKENAYGNRNEEIPGSLSR